VATRIQTHLSASLKYGDSKPTAAMLKIAPVCRTMVTSILHLLFIEVLRTVAVLQIAVSSIVFSIVVSVAITVFMLVNVLATISCQVLELSDLPVFNAIYECCLHSFRVIVLGAPYHACDVFRAVSGINRIKLTSLEEPAQRD